MIITYLGGESVKVQFGDTILAFNPISKDSFLKHNKFGADIVLSGLNHKDMNGVDQVTFGDKKPFVINGPGEYEVGGVFIKGFQSESNYDKERRINTMFSVTLEGMNICFLGAINQIELPKEADEAIDCVDVLLVPIGGDGVLDAQKAYKLAVEIGPKVIIPMHYGDIEKNPAAGGALKLFTKEAGENPAPVSKLTIKRKDLEGKEAEVVILEKE
ncbi:MBL fold metallo-hydrolase [Patescibacteria group bacterium]|nr:MBL fold metallo-hydrolase [Patescibacteria group bacterium]MDE1946323.1 MBL fold metallo-hydrolase [Patescibacteria group bacterium]MDE2010775.1 MBL fold metallo-hydrolase [Patescibacteria group bacterium]MDE2232660.1 MBL fold metallo-hydrolase [Patescibacteria group bacterium]